MRVLALKKLKVADFIQNLLMTDSCIVKLPRAYEIQIF